MLDTKGPEIITGDQEAKKITLEKDACIEITTNIEHSGDEKKIACDFEGLCDAVCVGTTIFLDGRTVTL